MGDENLRRDARGGGFTGGRRAYLRLVGVGLAGAVAGCPTDIDPRIDYFARSVALSGDAALVGAEWGHTDEDPARGYVFARDGRGWENESELPVSTDRSSHNFEIRPALDGDTALLGLEPEDDAEADVPRSAHVFVRGDGGWSQRAELTADEAGSAFGASVALSGDTVLIGAPEDEGPDGAPAGATYVFVRDGGEWGRQARLAPADDDPTDSFGSAVALDGDLAVVGDEFDGDSAGAAHVFSRTGATWAEEAKLVPDDIDSFDRFGVSVALDGDTALVGAYKDDRPNGFEAGSAYVFSRDDGRWTREAKLAAANGSAGDRFGTSIALSGDLALVGAPSDGDPPSGAATPTATDTPSANGTTADPTSPGETGANRTDANETATGTNGTAPGSAATTADGDTTAGNSFAEEMRERREEIERERNGAAYVFGRSGGEWSQEATLMGDGGDRERVGVSVALRGQTALVGAPGGGLGRGAAYVFVRRGGTWERQSTFSVIDRTDVVARA